MVLSVEEIQKQIAKLFEERRYGDVITRLDDNLLESFKDANLYAWKSRAYGKLLNASLGYKYAQKAIEINPLAPMGYLARGSAKANQELYNEAIEDFDKVLSLDQDNIDALINKGYVDYFLKNYESSVELYNLAVKLDPKNAEIYNKLGNSFRYLRKYDKAIKAFNQAIALYKNDPTFYVNRGLVWSDQNAYNKAINDYNRSILLKNNNPTAFNNRGVIWHKRKRYLKAIEDYTQAIKQDDSHTIAYENRAINYIELRRYNDALSDYEKCLEIKRGLENSNYQIILTRIEELKKKIENSWYDDIDESVKTIKEILLFDNECLTHFTSLSATKAMILDKSPFRLSEGNFLNDTSEGRELFKYLDFSISQSVSHDSVATIYVERPFIGSFVAENKHDDLTLWRMYGKEEQTEAMGSALTMYRLEFIEKLENKFREDFEEEFSKQQGTKFAFYKVAYLDNDLFRIPDSKTSQQKKINSVMQILKKQVGRLNASQKVSVAHILNDIAYLFKSADYQYENEVRLVIPGIGFKKAILTNLTPPRVYIDLINIIPVLHKITLGPKVERPDEWAAAFNYQIKTEMLFSTKKVDIVISHLPFK